MLRLISGAVAIGAALALVAPSAFAAPGEPVTIASDRGLYGTADPTFDGVFRQSMAILGLNAAGASIPTSAVDWLLGQQCDSGAFMAYRADTTEPCPAPDPVAFTGPDSNSTALAALALTVAGEADAADAAITWLLAQQVRGGGWAYLPGSAVDTSSTGFALAAVRSLKPAGKRSVIRDATNFLRRAETNCSAEIADRFGMPYQPGLLPDTFSSSQSLLGLANAFPVKEQAQRRGVPRTDCRDDGRVDNPRAGVARWLARQLNANSGALPNTYDPASTDWNSTALTIIGLVAARTAGNATDQATDTLAANIEDYIGSAEGDRPAALGTSVMVAVSTGNDPRDFGGTDLVRRLQDTRQR